MNRRLFARHHEACHLVVLVGEDLLTTLAAGHAVLLLLAHLGRSELLGLFVAFNLVAAHGKSVNARTHAEEWLSLPHSIKLLFFILSWGSEPRASTLLQRD